MRDQEIIARWWRGVTSAPNADAYENLLRTRVLPGIHRIAGYRGAYLFRRIVDQGVEFATLTLWDSMDAVRAFAGSEEATAVVPPEARELLREWDPKSVHYHLIGTPDDFQAPDTG